MSARWVSYLICIIGLPVYLWGMGGERQTGALPSDFAAEHVDYPVLIEGVSAGSPEHLRSLVERYPPGRRIRIERGGSSRAVTVASAFTDEHRLTSMISALCFWLVAFFVFAPRPDRDPGRVFFLSTFIYGLAIAVGTIAYPANPQGPDLLRPAIRAICVALLPALFVKMALIFPRRHPLAHVRPWILPALFLCALALAVWYATVMLQYFTGPTVQRWHAMIWSERVLDVYMGALVVVGCIIMYRSSRRVELNRERQQLKWLWWGITVGITPYVFLHAVPKMFAGQPIVSLHVARLCALAAPLAMAFAAIRYKLLDIDVIIRRSLIYGVLAALFGVVYLFLADLVGRWIAPLVPNATQVVPFAALLISVALYNPTRRLIGTWVDRTLFNIRHSHTRALKHFRTAVAGPRGHEDLARFVRRFVSRLLAPKAVAVAVRASSTPVVVGTIDHAIVDRTVDVFERRRDWWSRTLAVPNATSMPEVEVSDFPPELMHVGIRLVQPLAAYGHFHGLVLLGEKRSERRYIEEDLTLLAGVAETASETLEHLNLAQRIAEQRHVQERLDAIDRMKSDFLSRVAHDLRTPVTSIDWSARNLLDGLAGPLDQAQRTYLQAILTSAVHLDRLVTNLLEISRLEDGSATIELEPVGLARVAEEAMAGLLPIAGAKDVRFLRRLNGRFGPVSADRKKLVQVLVNLLENAIRYAPPRSEIEVEMERLRDHHQKLTVRDAGPGIPPGDEERIFERFLQGEPSPHGHPDGFGLGLFVVRAYVEAFSGSVRAANRPEGGAEFTVVLPEWSVKGTPIA